LTSVGPGGQIESRMETEGKRGSLTPQRRGVWLATFTLNGDRYYYACDDMGDLIEGRSVPIGADPMDAIDEWWALLDARCPVSLHDVSGLPSARLKLIS
jgi:hypothetical protein